MSRRRRIPWIVATARSRITQSSFPPDLRREDRNIPAALERSMAEGAHALKTVGHRGRRPRPHDRASQRGRRIHRGGSESAVRSRWDLATGSPIALSGKFRIDANDCRITDASTHRLLPLPRRYPYGLGNNDGAPSPEHPGADDAAGPGPKLVHLLPLSSKSAKGWSEWQDLNLRPPRPERGARHLRSRFSANFQNV